MHLHFFTGVHWTAKWELKSSDFILRSDTSFPSVRIGGIAGVFFVQKSTYDGPICFTAALRLSNLALILAILFFLV